MMSPPRVTKPQVIAAGAAVGVALLFLLFVIRGQRGAAGPASAADSVVGAAASDSVVVLDTAALRLTNVELLTVTQGSTSALIANGTITYDANRVQVVAPRTDGRVLAVRADLGQGVRAGTVLAVLVSPEVGAIRGDLERAQANLESTRRNYDRERRLFEAQIVPQKELLEAEAAFRTAEADARSAQARLQAVGASGGSGATFSLGTSISGVVVERNASPGQIVGPSSNLFTVADLGNVWITVDVYEADLSRIRSGAVARIFPSALSGEEFTGSVTYAGGVVDTASRTFKVRVEVANQALRLRPGMFAQVRIETSSASAADVIALPEIAVQDVNGKTVVFVATETAGRFIIRPVTLGPRIGAGTVAITRGLAAGDQVVTRGAFQLKAEVLKASFGESE